MRLGAAAHEQYLAHADEIQRRAQDQSAAIGCGLSEKRLAEHCDDGAIGADIDRHAEPIERGECAKLPGASLAGPECPVLVGEIGECRAANECCRFCNRDRRPKMEKPRVNGKINADIGEPCGAKSRDLSRERAGYGFGRAGFNRR